MNKGLLVSRWLLLLLIAASLIIAIYSVVQIRHAQQVKAYMADPEAYDVIPDDPYAAFAHALWLEQEENHDAALDEWTQVLSSENNDLVAAAYFNRGNINLREALRLYKAEAQHVPLTELAKQDYRNALAIKSDFWKARYNLEIALRLVSEDPELLAQDKREEISSSVDIESKAFKIDLP